MLVSKASPGECVSDPTGTVDMPRMNRYQCMEENVPWVKLVRHELHGCEGETREFRCDLEGCQEFLTENALSEKMPGVALFFYGRSH